MITLRRFGIAFDKRKSIFNTKKKYSFNKKIIKNTFNGSKSIKMIRTYVW